MIKILDHESAGMLDVYLLADQDRFYTVSGAALDAEWAREAVDGYLCDDGIRVKAHADYDAAMTHFRWMVDLVS